MPPKIIEDTQDVNFDGMLANFHEHIDNEGVDNEVWMAYNNIIRAKSLLPIQCAFFASMHQTALREAYIRRRQVKREELSRSRKFTGQVKIWVMELKDIDLKESLGMRFDGSLNLIVRVSVEGQVKGTTKSSPSRNNQYHGGFEPLKISQDVEFYVKRPTSVIHMEILHINDDQPEGSLTREVLVGQLLMNLQPLESQKTIRQWYPCLINNVSTCNIQLRMNYTFKEDVLQRWDVDSGLPRSEEAGGPTFTIGFIGVGQIGQCALDAVLKSSGVHPRNIHVSTRRPELLQSYEKMGVNVGFDNAMVAAKVDVLFIAVQPNNLTQMVSGVRGKIRSETLVVSLVAGLTGQRVASLLQVPCVFRTQIGGEWGLPEPDPADYAPDEEEAKLPAPLTIEDRLRAQKAHDRRKKEAAVRANVNTAMRALVPEHSDLLALIAQLAKVAQSLGLPLPSAKEVAQSGICDVVMEQRVCGAHVQLPELHPGARVKVTPTSSDVPDKTGIVKVKLKNREEYIVQLPDGTEVRSRRNRLSEEGVQQIEEGFSITEYRELPHDEQWAAFQEYFLGAGELALAGVMPTGEGLQEKSSFFSSTGKAGKRDSSIKLNTTGKDR